MLYIELSEDELSCFEELEEKFQNEVLVKTEHGFDMSSSTQVVIDIAKIVKDSLPYIVAAVQAVLVYRINNQQNRLKELEYELEKEKYELEKAKYEFEKEKQSSTMFEIRYSSNGESETLMRTSDVEQILNSPEKQEKLNQLMDEFKAKLEDRIGKT